MELLGTGYQKISSDRMCKFTIIIIYYMYMNNFILAKDACTVWCYKEKGGTKSRGWSFPDGTTCKLNKNKESTYCIGGYCKVSITIRHAVFISKV